MLANKALCAALVVLGAVATTGHAFTYQVKPSSNEILEASGALVVRWENRPGNSPDSMDVPVPTHVTVNLGYRKGNEAVLLYPPLSGTTSTVPVSDRVFSWKPMNFAMFETSEPLPPRDLKTQWFIQLKDQDSGYISNGNLFRIRGDDSSGAAASISAPAFIDSSAAQQAAPAAPAPSAQVPSNAVPNNAAAPAGAPAAAPAAAPATSSFSGGAPASNPSAPASNPSSTITQGTPRSAGTAVTAHSVALVAPLGVGSALLYTASR